MKYSHLTNRGKAFVGGVAATLTVAFVMFTCLWTPACTTTQQGQATSTISAVESDGYAIAVALNSLAGTKPSLAKVKATLYKFATNPNTTAKIKEVNTVIGLLAPLAGPYGLEAGTLSALASTLSLNALPVLAKISAPVTTGS